jgi:hypothetical protein
LNPTRGILVVWDMNAIFVTVGETVHRREILVVLDKREIFGLSEMDKREIFVAIIRKRSFVVCICTVGS